ncbi:hypothetical protein PHYC_03913 [Phycisphaerales bacterium]|nr:hypothetical protein PHYC_03913 [Phycisphaerales bacterium]
MNPSLARARNRAALWSGRAAMLIAAIAIGLWIAGLTLNDRWHWSQYFAWIPPWILLLTAAASCAARAALERARPPAPRHALKYWAACAALVLFIVFAEWRWYRLLIPASPAKDAVRVIAWNPAWARMSAFHERVLELKPDIAMFANPNQTADWIQLRQGMAEKTYALRQGTLVVVSRFPIRRFGWASLGIAPEPGRPSWWPMPRGSYQGGEALFLELDAPGWENGLIIWFIDLPSDPWMARRRMLGEAAASIAAFRGPILRRDDQGLDTPDTTLKWGRPPPGGFTGDQPATGFPSPDLVVGDFNTPRGSRSISFLAPGLTHAWSQAGTGPIGTFPRTLPLLHIDQALLGPRARAINYNTADLGAARHTAQVIDLAPAK